MMTTKPSSTPPTSSSAMGHLTALQIIGASAADFLKWPKVQQDRLTLAAVPLGINGSISKRTRSFVFKTAQCVELLRNVNLTSTLSSRIIATAVTSRRRSFFVGRRGVSQSPQTDSQDHLIFPVCLGCRAAPMSLTSTEEEYPGYQRRMFECPVCAETMTQWAGVSRTSDGLH